MRAAAAAIRPIATSDRNPEADDRAPCFGKSHVRRTHEAIGADGPMRRVKMAVARARLHKATAQSQKHKREQAITHSRHWLAKPVSPQELPTRKSPRTPQSGARAGRKRPPRSTALLRPLPRRERHLPAPRRGAARFLRARALRRGGASSPGPRRTRFQLEVTRE